MEQKMSIAEHIEKGAILHPTVIHRPTFTKEVTLRDVIEDFAKSQGVVLKNLDHTAESLMFSIDGRMYNILHFGRSVAKMLDFVVKPSQKIEILPAVAGG